MLACQTCCSRKVSASGPAGAGTLTAGHLGLKAGLWWLVAGGLLAAGTAVRSFGQGEAVGVRVVDGVVQGRRPLTDAIAEAMQFLKKADGGYVPGRTDGELAGYFTSAHVNPDGTRSGRKRTNSESWRGPGPTRN